MAVTVSVSGFTTQTRLRAASSASVPDPLGFRAVSG